MAIVVQTAWFPVNSTDDFIFFYISESHLQYDVTTFPVITALTFLTIRTKKPQLDVGT